MMKVLNSTTLTLATVAALTVGAAPAAAQLASPSTPALGMGDNYTAAARGYSAVAWNPAGLGLTGNPRFSLTLGTTRGIAGFGPITLADLKQYEDQLVPATVKQQWLTSVRNEGGQMGTGGGDVTVFAAHYGPVGIQLSSSVRAVSDISPGVAELMLFGNADDNGNPKVISLGGSELNMNAYSTGAVSFAMPFVMDGGARVSVGATAKYTMGHLLALGEGSSGGTTATPIGVNFSFPVVHTDFGEDAASFEVNNGSGLGLDLGIGYETDAFTFALAAQNVVNTFEWDEANLRYREAGIVFTESIRETSFDKQAVSAAPASLRGLIDDMTFKPSFSAGAMMRYSDDLRLTADGRYGSHGGMATRPPVHAGAGIEYTLFDRLPLRIGGAYVQVDEENAGFQYGGGLGVRLGAFNIAASAMQRSTDMGTDNFVMFSLISIGQ